LSKNRIVIVGNSAAGLSALETIRRVDPECPITIVSDEDMPAYSRVLTPYLISGELDSIFIRTPEYYREMKVQTLLGRKAVKVESERVVLEGGQALPYDRLLIATGSSAAVPENLSTEVSGVFTLKNIRDAQQIRRSAQKAKRALIVGGGLICLLVVRALLRLGLDLSIAVSSGRILSRMLDEEGSSIVQRGLEARGVKISTGMDIVGITSSEKRNCVAVSATGEEFTADLVIIAKGIRSNTLLARESGIETSRGILVDQYMRTSMANVFAAGDVAESKDLLIRGKRTICATWLEAIYQGELAGYNMAGIKRPTLGSLKMNVMEAADIPVASIGIYDAPEKDGEMVVRSEGIYRKLVLRKDRIVGAVLVGDVSDAGVITTMIRRGLKLSALKRLNLRQRFNFAGLMNV
jgi:nitrite reductase (NADH) large subunit